MRPLCAMARAQIRVGRRRLDRPQSRSHHRKLSVLFELEKGCSMRHIHRPHLSTRTHVVEHVEGFRPNSKAMIS
jgi:hypothetical protein